MKPVTILVADDHAVVRRGLRDLLELQPGWQVVADVATGHEAVARARELHPDVVVLDIAMPGLGGTEAIPLILQASPHSRVLVLTMHDADEFVQRTLQSGARGYVLKSDADEKLVVAVAALLQDRTFFPRLHSRPAREKRKLAPLSPREMEIVKLLAEGKSNKEVSVKLDISVRTVENHRARIMRRLGFRSFSELVRYAIRNQIIEP